MWDRVEFSGPATYNKVKVVSVEAVEQGKDWGTKALEIRRPPDATGRKAWVVWLPKRIKYTPPVASFPARPLSKPKTLQRCRKIAECLILSAKTPERLEELRTATRPPEWVEGLYNEN